MGKFYKHTGTVIHTKRWLAGSMGILVEPVHGMQVLPGSREA